MKPVHWVGSSREDLKSFPTEVKRDIGFALDKAQRGIKTPKKELDLITARLKKAQEDYEQWLKAGKP